MKGLIPLESVIAEIYRVRGQNVLFDRDLAELYGVETRILKTGSAAQY